MVESRKTISYSELRSDVLRTLAAPLDEINRHERREGGPLLSAVVTHHKDGDRISVEGVFRMAWELGSTKKATRSGTGDRTWSECGTIGRLILGPKSTASAGAAHNDNLHCRSASVSRRFFHFSNRRLSAKRTKIRYCQETRP